MKHAFTLAVIVAVLALLCFPCQSRIVEHWPYSKLQSSADLVIIGQPTTSTLTKERYPDKHPWPIELVGVETKVTILAVLKGQEKRKAITLFHYSEELPRKSRKDTAKDEPTPVIDGPNLLSFRTKERVLETKKGKVSIPAPDYLMFLRLRKDGRYEPVAGHLDSVMSVREVYSPYAVP